MNTLVSTRLRGLSMVAGGAAAVLLSVAPVTAAHAGEAPTGPPPGNKGTIKIHRTTTPDADRRNEPKVCAFRVVGFSFPDDSHLEISIEGHGGPNAGAGSFEGVVDADELTPEGDFAIAGPTLPDGMYKLTADNTTAPGGAKHKVFKVECSGGPAGGTTGGDTSGSAAPGGTGDVLSETLEPTGAAPGAEALGATAAPEELPRTGTHSGVLTIAGAALIATGAGSLVARRRLLVRL